MVFEIEDADENSLIENMMNGGLGIQERKRPSGT